MQLQPREIGVLRGHITRQPRCSKRNDRINAGWLEGSLAEGTADAGPMWISMSPCRTPSSSTSWTPGSPVDRSHQRDGDGHPAPGALPLCKTPRTADGFTPRCVRSLLRERRTPASCAAHRGAAGRLRAVGADLPGGERGVHYAAPSRSWVSSSQHLPRADGYGAATGTDA